MTLHIATPPQAVRLTVIMMKNRKPPSPTTQSQVTMTKTATGLSTAGKNFETTVSEMYLSSIN